MPERQPFGVHRLPPGHHQGLPAAGPDAIRAEIAGELHDCALQLLLAAQEALGPRSDHEAIARTRVTLDAAIAEIRRIGKGEPAPHLEAHAGMGEALHALCEEAERRAGLVTTLHIESLALEGDHEELLFVLAREFVRNVIRHAHATRLDIGLRRRGGDVELIVTDDGTGMPAERRGGSSPPGHQGLKDARRRVQGTGGSLIIEIGRVGGTTITVRLPFGEAAAAA